ncbi:hypothetical protein SKAU_G00390870 [Synaphobranchus kaupii]|uniref:Uncharacterized protein n=1 Tax=Synaphobranchus kaupii TaxID=118154 RepID=A0A9Q1ICS1_SYNKA|nr:hypothetical protein SKAU_G00390870 [Synaphobranchus kaupii]
MILRSIMCGNERDDIRTARDGERREISARRFSIMGREDETGEVGSRWRCYCQQWEVGLPAGPRERRKMGFIESRRCPSPFSGGPRRTKLIRNPDEPGVRGKSGAITHRQLQGRTAGQGARRKGSRKGL